MKYLSEYMEENQSTLFKNKGAFFAFNNTQLEEKKIKGIEYVNYGAGLICPKDNVLAIKNGIDSIYQKAIEQDKAENGKFGIIRRELYNHECFYTGEIDDVIESMKAYGWIEKDVNRVFVHVRATEEENH